MPQPTHQIVKYTIRVKARGTAMSKAKAAIRFDLEGPTLEWVENWRRNHAIIPTRVAAVRHLLELAIERNSQERKAPAQT
jgi:hypothetical protein